MEHPRFADSVESFATNGAGKRNSTRTIASSGTTRWALRPKCADGISIKPSFTQLPTRDTDVPREHRHKACASQKKSWSVVTLKSLQISNPVWVVYLHVKAWPVMGFYRLPAPTGTKQIIQLPAHLSEFPPPINFTRVTLRQVCHTACRVLWAEASSRGRLPRGITR